MYFLPKNIDFGVDFSYVKSFYGHFQACLNHRPLRSNKCLILLVIGSSIHIKWGGGELCTVLGMDWLFAMCLI